MRVQIRRVTLVLYGRDVGPTSRGAHHSTVRCGHGGRVVVSLTRVLVLQYLFRTSSERRHRMNINDMVLVSVDDHVVEPPHLFEGRLPAKYADLGPEVRHPRRRHQRLGLRGCRDRPTSRSTRWPAARPRSTAWSRPRSPSCAPAATTSTSASRTWTPTACSARSASRRSRSSAASSSPAPRTRTSRWRWCGPTTTGTSTTGAARIPAGSSRARCRRSGIPQVLADEVRRTAAQGCPRGHLLREPVEARLAELPLRPLGSVLDRRAATRTSWSACTSGRRRSW